MSLAFRLKRAECASADAIHKYLTRSSKKSIKDEGDFEAIRVRQFWLI
jgi:hypothetical protein